MNYLLTYLFGFRQKFGFGFHTLCEFYTLVRLFLILKFLRGPSFCIEIDDNIVRLCLKNKRTAVLHNIVRHNCIYAVIFLLYSVKLRVEFNGRALWYSDVNGSYCCDFEFNCLV